MSAYLKLPWRANLPERSDGALLASHIVDAEGIAVAQLAHHDDVIIRSKAAFIVRAANCHDELLALAEQFEKTVRYYMRQDEASGDDEGARLKGVTLRNVRDIIAEARRETP